MSINSDWWGSHCRRVRSHSPPRIVISPLELIEPTVEIHPLQGKPATMAFPPLRCIRSLDLRGVELNFFFLTLMNQSSVYRNTQILTRGLKIRLRAGLSNPRPKMAINVARQKIVNVQTL